MLWIFDESGGGGGTLCCECFVSLLRQWLLRTGTWKVLPAIMGACVQVTVGGLIWVMLVHRGIPAAARPAQDTLEMRTLIEWTAWVVGAIVLLVTTASTRIVRAGLAHRGSSRRGRR